VEISIAAAAIVISLVTFVLSAVRMRRSDERESRVLMRADMLALREELRKCNERVDSLEAENLRLMRALTKGRG
jgi:hypothetical protein